MEDPFGGPREKPRDLKSVREGTYGSGRVDVGVGLF